MQTSKPGKDNTYYIPYRYNDILQLESLKHAGYVSSCVDIIVIQAVIARTKCPFYLMPFLVVSRLVKTCWQ